MLVYANKEERELGRVHSLYRTTCAMLHKLKGICYCESDEMLMKVNINSMGKADFSCSPISGHTVEHAVHTAKIEVASVQHPLIS